MTPEQIYNIRKLAGRCSPESMSKILTSLTANPVLPTPYTRNIIDWVDLCSILLTELEEANKKIAELHKEVYGRD